MSAIGMTTAREVSSEQKMSNLLKFIGNASECRGCKAGIWWIVSRLGKRTPINSDGTKHWDSCPQAREFKMRQRLPGRSPGYLR